MKKIFALSPIIISLFFITAVTWLLYLGVFNKAEETNITSYTLSEIVKTSKLTTAKYIQNGIVDFHIEGKGTYQILYYAYVRPNIDLSNIEYNVDHDKKEVTVVLPKEFDYDVELLNDEEYRCYYFPKNSEDLTNRSAQYACESDAIDEAKKNSELTKKATESLQKSIKAILTPMIEAKEYSILFAN